MTRRIAVWGIVGVLVAITWAVYAFLVPGFSWNASGRMMFTVAEFTCPVAVIGRHFPLKLPVVIAINGATYALLGLVFEFVRQTAVPLLRRGTHV